MVIFIQLKEDEETLTMLGLRGATILWVSIAILLVVSCEEKRVDFNTEVRPILNKNCIACHGGVKQSGGFGMVFRANALGKTKNGKFGIVPGDPEASEMITRINHTDPELRMPLDKDPLSSDEIETLTRWIAQGAEWADHWAYQAPQTPTIPQEGLDWAEAAIDQFIAKRLKENGLEPAEEADPYDLVRRVHLDLIGLPPTPEVAEQYVDSEDPDKYERLVDDLLASPQFGERWATMWLDLARYADSRGYEKDSERSIWRYRDWVIRAFNEDMPFDQFTIEQLAGDLLPNPSVDQLIATGFHRNTLTNDEGGTDNEEYRIAAVIDRVNTTWEVWQGTTMSCAQCHSHPYDPITQKEYYESFAFFNNTADWDSPGDHPVLKDYHPEDSIQLVAIKEWVKQRSDKEKAAEWERFIRLSEPKIRPEDFEEVVDVQHFNRGDQNFMRVKEGSQIHLGLMDLSEIDRMYFSYRKRGPQALTMRLRAGGPEGRVIGSMRLDEKTGWGQKTVAIPIQSSNEVVEVFVDFKSQSEGYLLEVDGFLPGPRLPGDSDAAYARAYEQIDELMATNPKVATPVMVEKREPRITNLFVRGNWLVPGDTVQPGMPDLLEDEEGYRTRLDLAEWLVSPDNPMTGRVIVNRIWAELFGRGIVETVEDFGTLGEPPTHPELLDWLSIQLVEEYDWSLKQLIGAIVNTATYRQSAQVTEEHLAQDPANKWLARGPRTRLSAEQVRDQALATTGLLSDKMYGPSVMPPQPEGVWSVVYSNLKWETSEGRDAYRRGLYTYLRRSSPYPSFVTFDASEREVCVSRRINTNTPLQALVTMNDPVYLEAARALARELKQLPDDNHARVKYAYRRLMAKDCSDEKVAAMVDLLVDAASHYETHIEEAEELVGTKDPQLAGLTVMVNTAMNLDEFLVKN